MRADAHYVDQLDASAQPVVRTLATAQIDCRELPPPDRVQALTRSIAAHGVLQPLIVRKHGARFTVIAGRKRFAAAMAAGLTSVPCLLHDAEGAAAAAIAAADNLRIDDAAASSAAERDALRPLLQVLAADLSSIRTSNALLRAAKQTGLPQQVSADLIEAQAAHAAWLVSCMAGTFESTRTTPLAAIIQRVSDGFDAYSTLTGFTLEWSVTPAAAIWRLPEEGATAAINGAVFATLCCLEGVPKPRIELHADATQARTLRIEVVQRSVRVPSNIGANLAEQDFARPSDVIPALALRAARTVAVAHHGSAELTPLPGLGSVLQLTFGSAPAPS